MAYSNRQYQRAKHILGSTYDPKTNKNIKVLVDGVAPPQLSSLRTTRTIETQIHTDMGITSTEKGATMSLLAKLRSVLTMRKPPQDEVWIQFAGDGCSAGRYQQTAIAFRLMGMQGVESNSPFNTYSIVLFEGDDGYNAIASYVERMVHETNELNGQMRHSGWGGRT